jgi:hypothetical protein
MMKISNIGAVKGTDMKIGYLNITHSTRQEWIA